MDLFIAIALLCEPGSQYALSGYSVLECQKYYVKCVGDTPVGEKLSSCILNKKNLTGDK